jgi:hypothetical protein
MVRRYRNLDEVFLSEKHDTHQTPQPVPLASLQRHPMRPHRPVLRHNKCMLPLSPPPVPRGCIYRSWCRAWGGVAWGIVGRSRGVDEEALGSRQAGLRGTGFWGGWTGGGRRGGIGGRWGGGFSRVSWWPGTPGGSILSVFCLRYESYPTRDSSDHARPDSSRPYKMIRPQMEGEAGGSSGDGCVKV